MFKFVEEEEDESEALKFKNQEDKSNTLWIVSLIRHLNIDPKEFMETVTKEKKDSEMMSKLIVVMGDRVGDLLKELLENFKTTKKKK
jgi:hypothetical protein